MGSAMRKAILIGAARVLWQASAWCNEQTRVYWMMLNGRIKPEMATKMGFMLVGGGRFRKIEFGDSPSAAAVALV
jgi:hypothetical protein